MTANAQIYPCQGWWLGLAVPEQSETKRPCQAFLGALVHAYSPHHGNRNFHVTKNDERDGKGVCRPPRSKQKDID